jgi:general secretion pathway protein J
MCPNREIGPRPAPGRAHCAHRAVGFTLIELLVALAIFAILTGFAYRGLTAMLDSRVALERESRKWRDVSLFVGRMERDLSAALARGVTGASNTPLAPLSSVIESTASPEGIALTRSGSPIQENALAAPQRVGYRLREGAIERLAWAGVDAAPREEPTAVTVLQQVSALGFRFLDARGEWRSSWGLPGGAETALPAAVEVTLQLASGEKIVRLVDLPRAQ